MPHLFCTLKWIIHTHLHFGSVKNLFSSSMGFIMNGCEWLIRQNGALYLHTEPQFAVRSLFQVLCITALGLYMYHSALQEFLITVNNISLLSCKPIRITHTTKATANGLLFHCLQNTYYSNTLQPDLFPLAPDQFPCRPPETFGWTSAWAGE